MTVSSTLGVIGVTHICHVWTLGLENNSEQLNNYLECGYNRQPRRSLYQTLDIDWQCWQ